MSQPISRDFTTKEVMASDTADRQGIDNTPPPNLMDEARRLAARILQPLRDEIGQPLNVTSWYRSPALNEAVGGSETSAHLEARAADVWSYGYTALELAYQCVMQRAPFDELIIYPDQGRIHVAIKPSGRDPARELMTKLEGSSYLMGLHDVSDPVRP